MRCSSRTCCDQSIAPFSRILYLLSCLHRFPEVSTNSIQPVQEQYLTVWSPQPFRSYSHARHYRYLTKSHTHIHQTLESCPRCMRLTDMLGSTAMTRKAPAATMQLLEIPSRAQTSNIPLPIPPADPGAQDDHLLLQLSLLLSASEQQEASAAFSAPGLASRMARMNWSRRSAPGPMCAFWICWKTFFLKSKYRIRDCKSKQVKKVLQEGQ